MHICVQTYAFMASTQMQCMEPVVDPPPPPLPLSESLDPPLGTIFSG